MKNTNTSHMHSIQWRGLTGPCRIKKRFACSRHVSSTLSRRQWITLTIEVRNTTWNHTQSTEWCHFQLPWMTFAPSFNTSGELLDIQHFTNKGRHVLQFGIFHSEASTCSNDSRQTTGAWLYHCAVCVNVHVHSHCQWTARTFTWVAEQEIGYFSKSSINFPIPISQVYAASNHHEHSQEVLTAVSNRHYCKTSTGSRTCSNKQWHFQ